MRGSGEVDKDHRERPVKRSTRELSVARDESRRKRTPDAGRSPLFSAHTPALHDVEPSCSSGACGHRRHLGA